MHVQYCLLIYKANIILSTFASMKSTPERIVIGDLDGGHYFVYRERQILSTMKAAPLVDEGTPSKIWNRDQSHP